MIDDRSARKILRLVRLEEAGKRHSKLGRERSSMIWMQRGALLQELVNSRFLEVVGAEIETFDSPR